MPMTDLWDERYIYLHGWLMFMVDVGMYTSPMDPMEFYELPLRT